MAVNNDIEALSTQLSLHHEALCGPGQVTSPPSEPAIDSL